jgi:stearoyl-CoA desaturase (delta-9 desaturase)
VFDAMSPTTLPERKQADPRDRLALSASIPFALLHIIALTAPFFLPFHWYLPVVALALYYVRMFGVTAGYHRYFAHRSYKAGRGFQFFLAFLAETSVQKGVLWWAGHHRDHHRTSDTPDDIHSPVQRGFWWSHVGWIVSSRYDETPEKNIRDFTKYPELRFLDRHFFVPVVVFALATLVGGWALSGVLHDPYMGLEMLVWGFVVSTVLLWHGTFTINSLSHVFGRRRYPTGDDSRNNWLLALVTMGEGWHNNHHHFAAAARQGFYWWEVDMTYYVLKALSAVGLVWDLRQPTEKVLAEGRANDLGTLSSPATVGIQTVFTQP